MGRREDVAAKIDKNTEVYIAQMAQDVENNKEKVRIFGCIYSDVDTLVKW